MKRVALCRSSAETVKHGTQRPGQGQGFSRRAESAGLQASGSINSHTSRLSKALG